MVWCHTTWTGTTHTEITIPHHVGGSSPSQDCQCRIKPPINVSKWNQANHQPNPVFVGVWARSIYTWEPVNVTDFWNMWIHLTPQHLWQNTCYIEPLHTLDDLDTTCPMLVASLTPTWLSGAFHASFSLAISWSSNACSSSRMTTHPLSKMAPWKQLKEDLFFYKLTSKKWPNEHFCMGTQSSSCGLGQTYQQKSGGVLRPKTRKNDQPLANHDASKREKMDQQPSSCSVWGLETKPNGQRLDWREKNTKKNKQNWTIILETQLNFVQSKTLNLETKLTKKLPSLAWTAAISAIKWSPRCLRAPLHLWQSG